MFPLQAILADHWVKSAVHYEDALATSGAVVAQFEISLTRSSIDHSVFVSPASIAGVTRKV